ncbi:ParB N-terminal domain-containing protein [Dankookia sp. P2]|uniref:ParB N-terminal domain-containing protein n=1 Tax=Dankookia sp. P2 TaxID=3423955 RepID=UPI003D675E39
MREWGWTAPVLVDQDGIIIAGHGRVLAAQRLGITEVPVVVARGWSRPSAAPMCWPTTSWR